jgi:hypothetical protein
MQWTCQRKLICGNITGGGQLVKEYFDLVKNYYLLKDRRALDRSLPALSATTLAQ